VSEKVVLERDDLRRTLKRIAHEIAEANPEPERLAIVGIHTRGAVIARRLHALIGELTDAEHRELPIRPDYVGKNLPTALSERVNVHVAELDGADEVTISSLQEAATA